MSDGFDAVIHQPARLRIMASLCARDPDEMIDFTWLKRVLGLTDGNLSAHLATLEKANYVDIAKSFVDNRPRTRIKATASGRKAFARHVAALQVILQADVEP